MDTNATYYLIESSVLPEVYRKVIETKKLLSKGAARTISEAAGMSGISRSAFYKYKDLVFEFHESARDATITLSLILRDEPGALSGVISVLAEAGCNILTINQSIPSNGVAPVFIAVRTRSMTAQVDVVLSNLRAKPFVVSVTVLGSE